MERFSLLAMSRASEWWEFKLVPALAIAYAAAAHGAATPFAALPAIGLLLLALVPGAVFVSLLNDLTDREEDALAGKPNRQIGAGRSFAWIGMACMILAGLAFGWLWRDDLWLIATYASGWAAFALYSAPPTRLKRRGLAGACCDAFGANVVPALLATMLVARQLDATADVLWIVCVGLWAFAFGLRGILWHQMADIDADRRSNTVTAVMWIGEERCVRLVRRTIFPFECVMLIAWLAQLGLIAIGMAAIAFALYFQLAYARVDRFEMQVTLVRAAPRGFLLMQEYYDAFLPLSLLLAGAIAMPWNLALVALHMVLFPHRWRQILADFLRLRDPQYESRWRPPLQ